MYNALRVFGFYTYFLSSTLNPSDSDWCSTCEPKKYREMYFNEFQEQKIFAQFVKLFIA